MAQKKGYAPTPQAVLKQRISHLETSYRRLCVDYQEDLKRRTRQLDQLKAELAELEKEQGL